MKKKNLLLLAGIGAILGTSAYCAWAQEQPIWPVVCGSFDIESSPCVEGGYYPPGGCTCQSSHTCGGTWYSPPAFNETTFHPDDYGWKIYLKKAKCSQWYACIPKVGLEYCTFDSDCVRDLLNPNVIKVTKHEYVEPFPQWCNGGPV